MIISLKSEKVLEFFNLNITNTLLTDFVIVGFLAFSFIYLKRSIKEKPSKFQSFVEIIFEKIFDLTRSILGEKLDIKIFSFLLTFFLFILFSNWFGIMPFINSIFVVHDDAEKVHLFRSVYSDLNMTLSLAVISVVVINVLGILKLKSAYFKRFLNPIGVFELLGEFNKIISFAFRLFGNIFAGEIVLVIILSLVVLFVPIPFILLEFFVGFIQSFIFTVLTAVFLKVAISEH